MTRSPLLLLAVLAGCAPDLRDDFPFDGALPDGHYLDNVAQPDGTTLSTVDATRKDAYVYVDLDTGKDVPAGEAVSTGSWDLSFQRYKVPSNGGASGPGKVAVAVLKGANFATLKRAPADGYRQDGAEPVFNGVEGGWYVYDLGQHRLTTREDLVYVVRTGVPRFFKVKMKSYYDEHGTAGRLQFTWAPVDAP